MALVVADRVKETTTSVGTSTINLAGAEDNFETFVTGVGTGNTTYYAIVDKGNSEFEVGIGTVTSGTPDTLSRDTVLASSNSDALVNFSTGEKDVFCTQPADKAVYLDSSGQLVIDGTSVTATATELNYVDGVTSAIQTQLDSKLNLSGGTMTGALTLSGAPTADNHATTKIYVDDLIAAGIHYHDPVRVESPDSAGSLSATYDNGTSGVGATLTNNGTQAALVIDGVTLATSDRVLIYNQTNAFENGIYTVTNTGSASTNWVLTRATDADSYGVDNESLSEGTSVFVLEGDDGSGEVYACTTTGTITFGTTAINFSQIGRSAVITGNGGITVTGNEISANVNATVQTTGANSVSSTASRTYAVQVDGSNDLVVNVPWVDTDTNTDTTYTAGTGLTLSGTQFSVQDNYVLNSGDSIAGQLSVTSSVYPPLEVTRDAGAVTTGNYVSLKLNTITSGTPAAGLGSMIDFYVDDVIKGRAGYTNDGDFHIKQSDGSTDSITVDSTGDVTFSGSITAGEHLSLYKDVTSGIASYIDFGEGSLQDIRLGLNVFDSEIPEAGTALVLDRTNTGSGDAHLVVHGNIYANHGGTPATANRVLTTADEGSGNGLDADTVDTLHASQFLRSDADDTATGLITFSNKVTFSGGTDDQGTLSPAVEISSGTLHISHDEALIVFDQGQKSITSNDGQGNFQIRGGHDDDGVHIDSSSGTSGLATVSLNTDGQDGIILLGVGPRRNAGSAANFTYALSIDEGLNGLKWGTGSATYPDLATKYTVWHSGNDGSGSGLDADTVDGYHASSFVEQLADTASPNYQASSSRRVDPNASNPTNHHYAVMTFGNEGNVTGQLATHFQTGQPYTRGYNSSWSAWQKIWTDVNDGAGSGLDADTVDGIQGASLLRSDQSDTMTGELNVTHNGGATGSTAPTYSQANIECQTSSNYTPAISFHRGGYSAGVLYEYDGQLYSKAWVSRSQDGLLLSSGNISSYALPLSGGTITGAVSFSADTTDVINFTANSTNDARGISFNSRTALSADYNDGWLRLNSSSEFTNGTYSPLKIASAQQLVGGSSSVTSGGQIALRNTTNPYLSWHENATRRAYIQYLTSDNALFIYNEEAGNLRFRGNAAAVNFDFQTTGAANTGRLFVDADDFAMRHANDDSIVYGRKDSHTWLYYNGQWRIRTNTQGVDVRSETSTYSQIAMMTGGGDVRGYLYTNTSNDIGILDAGGNWGYRHRNDTEHEWRINDTQRMHLDNNGLEVITQYGDINIGPSNSSYCHITTDRSQFYFNKRLVVDSGQVQSYDEDLNLNRQGSTTHRLRITSGATISDQPVTIGGTTSQKLILSGSTTPYIRWQEGTTDKAYIQWNTSGYFDFRNQETGQFKFQSTVDGFASELFLIRNDTSTVDGNDLGSINFGHTDGDPDFPTQTAAQMPVRIVAEASETTGAGDDGARLRFFTKATDADKATSSVERMRIENNGYLEMYSRIDMNNNDIQGVDQIFHHGDTNTYMQFHAADQWRVVTGGTERLEVNNTNTTVQNNLIVNGNTTLGNALADTVTVNAKAIRLPNGSGDYDRDGTIEFGTTQELFSATDGTSPNSDEWAFLNVPRIQNQRGNALLWFNGYNAAGTFLSDEIGQYCLMALNYDVGDADDSRLFNNDASRMRGAYMFDGVDHFWHAGNVAPYFGSTVKMKLDASGVLSATQFSALSDKNAKENIAKITVTSKDLRNLQGYTFNFIGREKTERKAGVIAQEVLEVLPEAVSSNTNKNLSGEETTTLSVDYNAVVAAILNVVNELADKIDYLESKINAGSSI